MFHRANVPSDRTGNTPIVCIAQDKALISAESADIFLISPQKHGEIRKILCWYHLLCKAMSLLCHSAYYVFLLFIKQEKDLFETVDPLHSMSMDNNRNWYFCKNLSLCPTEVKETANKRLIWPVLEYVCLF